MTSRNRIAKFAQAFALFALIAAFAAAAFPSASHASARLARPVPPAATGKVYIYVADQTTGKAIAGAEAYFRAVNGTAVVAKGVSDQSGTISLQVAGGLYAVEVRAKGYKGTSSIISVVADGGVEAKIGLYPESMLSDPPWPASTDPATH